MSRGWFITFEGGEGTGRSWFCILRMYGPLAPWIDKTGRPGEIELVKQADRALNHRTR